VFSHQQETLPDQTFHAKSKKSIILRFKLSNNSNQKVSDAKGLLIISTTFLVPRWVKNNNLVR
jgi:hypothetical protein